MRGEYYNSRRYHSFFEGYTEKTVEENGKQKIVRIYTGDYYRPQLTARQRGVRKGLNCVLYLCTLGLYVYCATRPLQLNLSPAVAICQGLEALLLLWLLVSVADYTTAKEQMTVRVYRTASRRLIGLSLAAAVVFGLMSALYLALSVWYGDVAACLRLFPFSLACSAAMFALGQMERNVAYEVVCNRRAPVKDGSQIRY